MNLPLTIGQKAGTLQQCFQSQNVFTEAHKSQVTGRQQSLWSPRCGSHISPPSAFVPWALQAGLSSLAGSQKTARRGVGPACPSRAASGPLGRWVKERSHLCVSLSYCPAKPPAEKTVQSVPAMLCEHAQSQRSRHHPDKRHW